MIMKTETALLKCRGFYLDAPFKQKAACPVLLKALMLAPRTRRRSCVERRMSQIATWYSYGGFADNRKPGGYSQTYYRSRVGKWWFAVDRGIVIEGYQCDCGDCSRCY
jgi:hypothetical protein